jgi:hypothetical protein
MSGCLVNRGVMECLVFAYLARTEKWKSREWYGQAGRDLGRDIWGVCLRFVMEAAMESAMPRLYAASSNPGVGGR